MAPLRQAGRAAPVVVLEVGRVYRVFIAYIESSGRFWVQLEDGAVQLEQLNQTITDDYTSLRQPDIGSLRQGLKLLARYHEAGEEAVLYRAVIKSIENGKYQVYFFDYGNTQVCDLQDLREMQPQYSRLPPQALECMLTNSSAESSNMDQYLDHEDAVFLKVREIGDDVYIVDLGMTEDELESQSQVSDPVENDVMLTYTGVKFDMGRFVDVCISHIEPTGLFHLQLVDYAPRLDNLMCELASKYNEDSPFVTKLADEMPCVVYDPTDKVHYRAQLISSYGTQCNIRYVDFGMLHTVKVSCLRKIQKQHTQLPMQAIKCSLTDVENVPNKKIVQVLEQFLGIGLVARVVLRTGPIFEMLIMDTSDGQDRNLSELVKQAVVSLPDVVEQSQPSHQMSTRPLQPPIGTPRKTIGSSPTAQPSELTRVEPAPLALPLVQINVSEKLYVSTVMSGNAFYGQLVRFSTEDLDNMQADLLGHYQDGSPVLTQPKVGDPCCTTFSGDQEFYRAVVVTLTQNAAQVRFVDFGNEEEKALAELYVLAPSFYQLPIQGITCHLLDISQSIPKDDLERILLDKEMEVLITGQNQDAYSVVITSSPQNTQVLGELQKFQAPPSSRQVSMDAGPQHQGAPQTFPQQARIAESDQASTASCSQQNHARPSSMQSERITQDGSAMKLMGQNPPESASGMEGQFISPLLPQGAWEEVQVTHIDDPEHFYAQLTGSGAQLDSLMEQLETYCGAIGEGGRLDRATLGMSCLAKYKEDNIWYRALVTGVRRSGEVEVQFVDYGNRETMSVTELKTIPPAHMRLPEQTILCGLKGVSHPESLWPAEDIDMFYEMSTNNPMTICIDSMAEDRYLVHMFSSGTCLNQTFGDKVGKLSRGYRGPGGPPRHVGTLPSPASLEAAAARSLSSTPAHTPQASPSRPEVHKPSSQPAVRHQSPPQETASKGWASWQKGNTTQNAPAPPAAKPVPFKPMPLEVNAYYDMYVSYILSPGNFWCQLAKSEALDALMNQIASECSRTSAPAPHSVHQGMKCCAQYSEDDQWYRASVLSCSGDTAKVRFVDYGNEESVVSSRLRPLSELHASVPMHGVQCRLSGVQPCDGKWSDTATAKFEELSMDKQLVLGVVEKTAENICVVDLVDTAQQGQPSLHDLLILAGVAMAAEDPAAAKQTSRHSSVSSGSSQSRSTRAETYKRIQINVGKQVEVDMAHVNSPLQFWCHPVEYSPQLEELMAQLETQYTALKERDLQMLHAKPGTVCAARYTEDDSWYRAEVISAENGKFKVRFVDYGNGEWLSSERLKILSRDYLELPAQAIECSLAGLDSRNKDWSEECVVQFEDMTFNKTLMATIVSIQNHIHTIHLKDVEAGSADLAQALISKGLAVGQNGSAPAAISKSSPGRPVPGQLPSWGSMVENETGGGATLNLSLQPQQLSPGDKFKAFIAWVESPLDFYCQKRDMTQQLEDLQQQLNDTYEKLKLSEDQLNDVNKGVYCVAQFSQDGSWYRALIQAVKGQKAKVRFVDYGNCEVVAVTRLKTLRAEMAELPILTIQCCLSGVKQPPGGNWGPDVERFFQRICSQELNFTVAGMEGDRYKVSILDSKNADVSEQINNGGRPVKRQETGGGFREQRGDTKGFGERNDSRSFGRKDDSGNSFRRQDEGRTGGRNDSYGRRENSGGFGKPPAAGASGGAQEDWGDDTGGASAAPAAGFGASGFGAPAAGASSAPARIEFKPASMPRVGDKLQVVVTYTDSLESIWCQRKESMSQLDELMEKIEGHYGSAGSPHKPLNMPKVGLCCMAKYSEDNSWYRARVTEVPSATKVRVHFVDYGNTEECEKSVVKEISQEYADLPIQALQCSLDGLSGVAGIEAKERLEELTMDFDCEVVVSKVQGSTCVVVINVDGASINQQLQQQFASITTSSGSVSAASKDMATATLPVEPCNGFISHIESPDQFYMQLASIEDELSVFSTEVNEYYQALNGGELVLSSVKIGQPCCCLFEEDSAWYRGTLEEVAGSETKVRFVDYGNSQVTPASALKQLATQFLRAPYAIECHLHGVKAKLSGWSDEAMDFFSELVMDKSLQAHFKGTQAPVPVQLTDEGQNINAQMLPHGEVRAPPAVKSASSPPAKPAVPAAVQPSVPAASKYAAVTIPSGKQAAFVSHVDSPSAFYLQLPSQTSELQAYMDALYEEYAAIPASEHLLGTPSPGQPCCAKYSEDQSWYRALIESQPCGAQVTVRFVDYGNAETVTVTEVKQLVGSHADRPPYAIKCQVESQLAKVARDKFSAALTDKDLEVHFKSGSEPYVVSIAIGGQSLEDILMVRPTSEPVKYPVPSLPAGKQAAFISQLDSPSCFFVQFPSQTEELQEYMDKLYEEYSGQVESDYLLGAASVGQACCAKYSEDQSWYRAIIEAQPSSTEVSIRFVDYGNTESVPVAEVRKLVPTYAQKPPYAIKCGLNAEIAKATDPAKFSEAVTDKDLEIEFESTCEPYKVKISIGGESLEDLLGVKDIPVPVSSEQPSRSFVAPAVPIGTHAAYTTHLDSPTSFYIQLTSESEKLQQYMDALFEEYNALGADELQLHALQMGEACCAKYSVDGSWYRAVIEDVEPSSSKVSVRFVDYGNQETVPSAEIKKLLGANVERPPYAVRCQLSSQLAKVDSENFSEAVTDQDLEVEFVSHHEPCLVKIAINGKSLEEILGLSPAQEAETPPTTALAAQVSDLPSIPAATLNLGSHTAFLSHTESPGHFYVQLAEQSEELAEFAENLNATYSSLGEGECRLEAPQVGQACCALFSEDSLWYRALITSIHDSQATVRFVDYGNSEQAPFTSLCILQSEFAEKPAFTIHCMLVGGKDEWTEEDTTVFTEKVGENELELIFKTTTEPVEVQASVGEECLNTLFSAGGRTSTPNTAEALESTVHYVSKSTPASSQSIQVSHVDNPSSFYVQLIGELDNLESFADRLNTVYTNLSEEDKRLSAVQLSQPCCALFSEDSVWYRAVVEAISEENITVRFVDYGNVETTTLENIRMLDNDFLSVAPYAIQCQLKGLPATASWSPADVERFESLVLDKELEASFTSDGSICSLIPEDEEISVAFNCSVTEEPSEAHETAPCADDVRAVSAAGEETGPGLPDPQVPAEPETIFISAIVSPAEFYLHCTKDDEARDELVSNINESYNQAAEKLTSVVEGQVCCAKFTEDNQWYRAVVRDIVEDSATVFFLDFGNCDEVKVSELCRLKPEFSTQSPMALQCRLKTVDADSVWADVHIVAFTDLTLDKQLKATFLSSELPFEVDLEDEEGKTITTEMLLIITESQCTEETSLVEDGPSEDEAETEEHTDSTSKPGLVFPSYPLPSEPTSSYVAHTESLNQIYLHVDPEKLDNLMSQLSTIYEAPGNKTLENPCPDMPCAVMYAEDKQWYRALISEVDDETATVLFIDYGNHDSCPVSSLMQLVPELVAEPRMAIECALEGWTEPSDDEAVEKFLVLTADKELTATFTQENDMCRVMLQDDNGNIVNLLRSHEVSEPALVEAAGNTVPAQVDGTHDHQSVEEQNEEAVEEQNPVSSEEAIEEQNPVLSEEAVEEQNPVPSEEAERIASSQVQVVEAEPSKHADTSVPDSETAEETSSISLSWPEFRAGEELSVYVPQINSPHNFYCQLAQSSREALPLLQDQIQALYSSGGTPVTQPQPGLQCVAKYEEDDSWYRAEVTGFSSDRLEVLFVDYGNTEQVPVTEVKALETDVAQLPRQAFPASLASILPLNEVWDEASCARFEELTQDKEFTCQVLQVNREGSSVVVVDLELLQADSTADSTVSQVLIDAGYAEIVEPITGGNTSKFIKESTMTSILVDTSRADVSQACMSQEVLEEEDESDDQTVLIGTYVKGGNPDDFLCTFMKEHEEGAGDESSETLRCRLAGVEADTWTEEACQEFEKLCDIGELSLRLAGEVEESSALVNLVYVYNTTDASGESVNYQLVSRGHAWVSPTSELEIEPSQYDELAETQDKLESTFLEVSEVHHSSLGSLNGEQQDDDDSSHVPATDTPAGDNITSSDLTNVSHDISAIEEEISESGEPASELPVEQPVSEQPVSEQPVSEQPVSEQPVSEQDQVTVSNGTEAESAESEASNSDIDECETQTVAVTKESCHDSGSGDAATAEGITSEATTEVSAGGDSS